MQLPELEIGQEVKVPQLCKNQTWEKGTCTEKLLDRSYIVQSGGITFRRNRQLLKPARKPSVQVKPDTNTDNDVHREPVQQVKPTSPAKTSTSGAVPEETKASVPGIQTNTHSIRSPLRFKDFDVKLETV